MPIKGGTKGTRPPAPPPPAIAPRPKGRDLINQISWITTTITAENPAYDGTGTPGWVFIKRRKPVFVKELRCMAAGTTVQGVLRIFINNGKTHTRPANNSPFKEQDLAVVVASATTAKGVVIVTLNKWIPAGYRINCLISIDGGDTFTGAWHISAWSGQYSDAEGAHELYE